MSIYKLLVPISILFMLSGCANMQTTDPYTGEKEASKTAGGASIGAIAGAVIGAIASDDPGKGALVGAAIGGVTGAGVGSYMDRQEAELRRNLQGSGVQVERYKDNIRLVMASNITFDLGSANLKSQFFRILNSVGKVLKKYDKTRVNVTGHTDNTGSFKYNQHLSVQRARTVAAYLESQGVNENRFFISGMADQEPIASNATASGRAMNRRVEITLQPLDNN